MRLDSPAVPFPVPKYSIRLVHKCADRVLFNAMQTARIGLPVILELILPLENGGSCPPRTTALSSGSNMRSAGRITEGKIPELHPTLAFRPWPGGDPLVVLESIMARVDEAQQKQVMGIYLDSIASTRDIFSNRCAISSLPSGFGIFFRPGTCYLYYCCHWTSVCDDGHMQEVDDKKGPAFE